MEKPESKIKLAKIVVIVVFLLLGARAAQLQIIQGGDYFRLAENNRLSVRPINAPRGRIYSADEEVLVANKLAYDVYFQPNELSPKLTREELFTKLADVSGNDKETLENNYLNNQGLSRPGEGVILLRSISSEKMIKIAERKDQLQGIDIRESPLRDYVHGDLGSHIIGHIGEISEEELRDFVAQGLDYTGGDTIGIAGLERQYEEYLKGQRGFEEVEVNHLGHKEELLESQEPVPGYDLKLSVDWGLQQKTEERLEEKHYYLKEIAEEDEDVPEPGGVAAAMMDINSGDILAMGNYPRFDPNKFATGFTNADYDELRNDPLQPMLNRNTMFAVSPGSVFKTVTGMAALENLEVDGDTSFFDATGEFHIPGWSEPFRNWMDYGEGELDFTRAIGRSNNIVFYELSYELYEEYQGSKLVETAREFGLGEITGIDLPNERAGLVPDGQWKRDNLGEGWYPGDSVNLGIGQGFLSTTPMQILQLTSAIANRGQIYQPTLVQQIVDSDGEVVRENNSEAIKSLPFSQESFEIIEEGLLEVTMTDYGTASAAFSDFPLDIAGKTGTAQLGYGNLSHAWFTAYGPVPDPEIAIVVFIERGDSSQHAIPIAADLLAHYFEVDDEYDGPEEPPPELEDL